MAMDMVDRLSELHKGEKLQENTKDNIPEEFELEECLTVVDELSQQINKIEPLVDRIKAVLSSVFTSTGETKEDAMERHAELMEQVKQSSRQALKGLKRLDDEVKSSERGPERNSAEVRIKKSQHAALSRRLREVMMEYNQVEQDYSDKLKDNVRRKLKIVGRTEDLTDEKVEEIVESKDPLFAQDLLIETKRKKEDLKEIEFRKKEILKLEEDIKELHEMFYDMMLMVDDQDDLFDCIENYVEKTAVYVAKAAKHTTEIRRYKSSNRRLKWLICLVVSLVVGVLLIVIGAIIAAIIGIQNN